MAKKLGASTRSGLQKLCYLATLVAGLIFLEEILTALSSVSKVSSETKEDAREHRGQEVIKTQKKLNISQEAEQYVPKQDKNENQTNWKDGKMRRVDIVCCGIGDRMKFIANAAILDKENASRTAIHWGPCHNHSKNVFGEIFKTDSNSQIVPFRPSEGAPPFPQLTPGMGKAEYDEVPAMLQRNLCNMLLYGITDNYMEEIKKFKLAHQWETVPVIGLHVRTGNTFAKKYDRESTQILSRKGGQFQQRKGLRESLRFYMDHVLGLAHRMGISNNFRVLVVGDSPAIFEALQNMSDIPNWFHRKQAYHDTAHPLVYPNLRNNNGGKRCQLDWFAAPIIDLHLIASTAALVTSMYSGFPELAELCLKMQDRPVCHCCQDNSKPETCACIGEAGVLVPARLNATLAAAETVKIGRGQVMRLSDSVLWSSDGSAVVLHNAGFALNCTAQIKGCQATPHKPTKDSFADKWIYLHGDSTICQLFGAFISHFKKTHLSFDATKTAVRETCEAQTHRQRYVPTPAFGTSNCFLNEKTCEWKNTQTNGTTRITFDWKHFVLEDREKYMFGEGGLIASMPINEHPDVLVTKIGFHICAHTVPPTGHLNLTQTEVWLNDLQSLIQLIRSSFHGPVVWLTPSIYHWGKESAHTQQETCMDNVATRVRDAVSIENNMYIVEAAEIENAYSKLSGNWGMHRPEHVASLVGYVVLSLLNCLFGGDEAWLPCGDIKLPK